MITVIFNLRNPFSHKFKSLYDKAGKLWFKHKCWEFQIMQTSDLLTFCFRWTFREDHAGVGLELGLLGYTVDFHFFDIRHWNIKTNSWETYENTDC